MLKEKLQIPSLAQQNEALKSKLRTVAARLQQPVTAEEVAAVRRRLAADAVERSAQEQELRNLFKKLDAAQQVDLLFLCDCTGSMEPFIAEVNQSIELVVARVQRTCPALNLRLAFVGYRDFNTVGGPDEPTVLDFVGDVATFKAAMRGTRCAGNYDTCEDVASGLAAAARLAWRQSTRVMLHVADAPSHGPEYHGFVPGSQHDLHPSHPSVAHIPTYLKELQRLGVAYHFFSVGENLTAKMVQRFNQHVPQAQPFVTAKPLAQARLLADLTVTATLSSIRSTTIRAQGATLRTALSGSAGGLELYDVAAQLKVLQQNSERTSDVFESIDSNDWRSMPTQRVSSLQNTRRV